MKIKEVIGSLTATPTQNKPLAIPKPSTTTTPTQVKNSADKARIDALKTTADATQDRLKTEKDRQKKQKAVQTISSLSAPAS
ncbi:hypothetical protein ACO0KY_19415 [Undibacterium sp. Dicai25W]|uniref:hypothetical protein n=1 Tax=Undibacterium sp. Dicai25W TaxID=3413034 RepID=UPI003BF07D08